MPVLRRRDLVASVLVAALLILVASGNFLSGRALTAATLMLTGATVLVLADADQPDAISWLITALAVGAVTAATLSLLSPSVLLLSISVGMTVTLWSVQLAEHVAFRPPDGRAPTPTTRR